MNKQYSRLDDQLRKLLTKAQDEINGTNQKKQVDLAEMRKYSLSKMQERPATPVHIADPELAALDVKCLFIQIPRPGRATKGANPERGAAHLKTFKGPQDPEHHVRGQGKATRAH